MDPRRNPSTSSMMRVEAPRLVDRSATPRCCPCHRIALPHHGMTGPGHGRRRSAATCRGPRCCPSVPRALRGRRHGGDRAAQRASTASSGVDGGADLDADRVGDECCQGPRGRRRAGGLRSPIHSWCAERRNSRSPSGRSRRLLVVEHEHLVDLRTGWTVRQGAVVDTARGHEAQSYGRSRWRTRS